MISGSCPGGRRFSWRMSHSWTKLGKWELIHWNVWHLFTPCVENHFLFCIGFKMTHFFNIWNQILAQPNYRSHLNCQALTGLPAAKGLMTGEDDMVHCKWKNYGHRKVTQPWKSWRGQTLSMLTKYLLSTHRGLFLQFIFCSPHFISWSSGVIFGLTYDFIWRITSGLDSGEKKKQVTILKDQPIANFCGIKTICDGSLSPFVWLYGFFSELMCYVLQKLKFILTFFYELKENYIF